MTLPESGQGGLFDCPVPAGFGDLPGPFRMLLGGDGTLTRSLSFLSGGAVSVERVALPADPSELRKVFLTVPGHGRLVFARTRLIDSVASRGDSSIGALMTGKQAIGPAMEACYGPLLRDEFAIFVLSGTFDRDCPEAGESTWGRSYRMSTSGGIALRIEEFFLPSVVRIAGC